MTKFRGVTNVEWEMKSLLRFVTFNIKFEHFINYSQKNYARRDQSYVFEFCDLVSYMAVVLRWILHQAAHRHKPSGFLTTSFPKIDGFSV